MKRLLILAVMAAALLALLVAPPLATAGLQHGVLARFQPAPYGAFAEGMAADSQGRLVASLNLWGFSDETTAEPNTGEVWQVTPAGKMTRLVKADITPYGQLMGVAIDGRDRVFVGIWDLSALFGLEDDAIGSGVFMVKGDQLVRVALLPHGSAPNGLALHGAYLYITDSGRGAIWRVRPGGSIDKPTKPWFQSKLLAPSGAKTAVGLGANGIVFKGSTAYVDVSDFGRILRVPVKASGEPGTPTVVCKLAALVRADGMAFDRLGRIWVVTNGTQNASGSICRVSASGRVTRLAANTRWLAYPTTPVFGRTAATARSLFVENGAFYSYADPKKTPDILALQTQVSGLPRR